MGIKIDQETNTRPMEKELAQSDLPSKRKVPNTIQKLCRLHQLEPEFTLSSCATTTEPQIGVE